MERPEPLYHAATAKDWAARTETHYEPSGLRDEGFVHLSFGRQLLGTLHKHYPGRQDLMLLTVDPAGLTSKLVLEDLYGSGVEFPHVYGPLDLAAIVSSSPIRCDADGRFDSWQPDTA